MSAQKKQHSSLQTHYSSNPNAAILFNMAKMRQKTKLYFSHQSRKCDYS